VRSLFVAAFLALAACPGPAQQPIEPLSLTVNVAAGAPAADPSQSVGALLPAGAPDGVQIFDLGDLGVKDGETGEIDVDVKAGLGSLMVLVYSRPEDTVILAKAVDPTGTLVVSDIDQSPPLGEFFLKYARGFPAQVFSTNRVFGSLGTGAFLVPNTPSVPAASGRWKLKIGNYNVDLLSAPPRRSNVDKPVHVVILAKGVEPGHGSMDLNLYFTGSSGLTAATAPNNATLNAALAEMKKAYAGAKIDVDNVRYADIDPQLASVSLVQNSCEGGDLDKVAAAGSGAPGIDLFFVDHFTCFVGQNPVDVGSSFIGIAAGIPGPAFVHGTTHSGVAVSTSFAFSGGDPKQMGVVMAHETGHFLGLYHTRESGSGVNVIFDEIDDTANDLAGAADNLMYFANQDNITITDGQAHVLRSNPFIK
jgi:hypothetical protein